jgi:hypothetical protein
MPGNQQEPKPEIDWDKEYLCMIFCACLAAWRSDSMTRSAARLGRDVIPDLNPGPQPKRLDRQECVEKELRGHPIYKPEVKYRVDGRTRYIDVTVLDAATRKIKTLVEMKFPGDRWQPGQKKAYKKLAKREGAKLVKLDERSCKCKK